MWMLSGKAEVGWHRCGGLSEANGSTLAMRRAFGVLVQHPLFTDNTTANLSLPRNPDLAFYHETQPGAATG